MMNPAEFAPIAGHPLHLAPMLTLVLAPNPSPMTHLGTNTYVVGDRDVVIIDPGPDDAGHLAALMDVIGQRQVRHILMTHSHLDHSPLARPLAAATKAPICAFGDSLAGRSNIMGELARQGLAGGGEGIDHDFQPDVILEDGAVLSGTWGHLRALHTPGHIGNHLCFVWGDAVFTGDHVMGWASSLVSPPDGDLTDFMASCRRLQTIGAALFYPGHGAPVDSPAERLAWLIDHRKGREHQILETLKGRPFDIPALTRAIYNDVPDPLLPAAARNVFAHLIDLHQRQCVTAHPALGLEAEFNLTDVPSEA